MQENNFWQKLNKPFFVLAPMDGVTDHVFRELVAEVAKPDVMFNEFTHVSAILRAFGKMKKRLEYSVTQRPIVAQIWGTNPDHFEEVAKILQDMGFDGIDINMGCPSKTALRVGGGAGHIKDFELAGKVIQATKRGATAIPVSVKTRIGLNEKITEEWAAHLLQQDIAALTIHGRTAKELSKVPNNWDEIAKVVKIRDALKKETVIIGNGDIKSLEEANTAHTQHGVDGVMIGRGIFTNLWLFDKQQKDHTTKEKIEYLIKHFNMQKKFYEGRNFEIMKKYTKIYLNNFEGANELRQQLMETSSFEEALSVVSLFYAQTQED